MVTFEKTRKKKKIRGAPVHCLPRARLQSGCLSSPGTGGPREVLVWFPGPASQPRLGSRWRHRAAMAPQASRPALPPPSSSQAWSPTSPHPFKRGGRQCLAHTSTQELVGWGHDTVMVSFQHRPEPHACLPRCTCVLGRLRFTTDEPSAGTLRAGLVEFASISPALLWPSPGGRVGPGESGTAGGR